MQFKRFDRTLLLEAQGINQLWKRYQNKLDRDTFERVLQLDPTYKGTNNLAGSYGEWILKQYCSDKDLLDGYYSINNDDVIKVLNILNPQHLTFSDILYYFDIYKKWLTEKDINQYIDIIDVLDALSNMNIPEKAWTAWLRGGLNDEEVVFIKKFNNYSLFQPQSWRGSVSIAYLSGWCTAGTREVNGLDSYNEYTHDNKDKLYVLIPNDQLVEGVPVALNNRHDWLQFTPNYPQYAWGYKDGKLNEEESVKELGELSEMREWYPNNLDVAQYFDELFPNKGFDGDLCFIKGFDRHALVQHFDTEMDSTTINFIYEHCTHDETSIHPEVISSYYLGKGDVVHDFMRQLIPEKTLEEKSAMINAIRNGIITKQDLQEASRRMLSSKIDALQETINEAFDISTDEFCCSIPYNDFITKLSMSDSSNNVLKVSEELPDDLNTLEYCLLLSVAKNIIWPSMRDVDVSHFWSDVIDDLWL